MLGTPRWLHLGVLYRNSSVASLRITHYRLVAWERWWCLGERKKFSSHDHVMAHYNQPQNARGGGHPWTGKTLMVFPSPRLLWCYIAQLAVGGERDLSIIYRSQYSHHYYMEVELRCQGLSPKSQASSKNSVPEFSPNRPFKENNQSLYLKTFLGLYQICPFDSTDSHGGYNVKTTTTMVPQYESICFSSFLRHFPCKKSFVLK